MVFAGIMIAMLCVKDANAQQCAPGCFCVNNGQMPSNFSPQCSVQSQLLSCGNDGYGRVWYFRTNGMIRGVLSCPHSTYANYYVDEFSEIYIGRYGMYGFRNDDLIVMPADVNYGGATTNYEGVYQCPTSYPNSDAGARTLTDCFKYNSSGQKVYYGSTHTIRCSAGQYLPANATQCVSCSASQNHICPGGLFEQSDVIQGLKVNCQNGHYLPANATQCTACNTNFYLCPGGIYNAGEITDQGSILTSGYFSGANHNFITCQPGYCVPPVANQCVKCTNANSPNHACPGGMFYVDGPYQFARGRVLCAYGHPNSDHTECVATSTSPSFMLEKVSEAVVTEQNQPEMSTGGQTQQPTVSGQPVQVNVKGNKRFSAKNKIQPVTQPAPKTQSDVVVSQPEPDPIAEQQKEIETAKKLISAGVAIPVK